MKKKILAILPISIGGRLTTSSIIDGYRQNNCIVTIYDELQDKNLKEILSQDFDQIVGYDYSAIKLKVQNRLKQPTVNYFSDNIKNSTSGPEWEKYYPYLNKKNNYTFYWDKVLAEQEDIKNLYYLPHFVNFDIYKDLDTTPEFDVMFAGRLDTEYRLNFFEKLMEMNQNLKFAWFAIDKHYKDALERSKKPLLLTKCYQGFIDNETDMAKAINNTRIVFNINSQGISSLNYRTIQTIACKRLLISDVREELNLFEGNIITYKNIYDLSDKINYYLSNKKEYEEIVENCHIIAKNNHNSKDCVKFILDKIDKLF